MQKIDRYLPGKLVHKATMVHRITNSLRSILPEPLASHIWFADFRADGAAVIVTDNNSWAAAIRFEQPRLLECIRQFGRTECPAIKIKVVPQQRPAHQPHNGRYKQLTNRGTFR